MKTTYVVALIAAISAVSIGAISMNDFTVPLAIASASPESGTMMGHVEYVLRDADGNIKSYAQADNMVVNRGDDCAIAYMFQPTSASSSGTPDVCTNFNPAGFQFIGIGNFSSTIFANSTSLHGTASTVASSGTNGLMSVRWDNNTAATASSNGGTVVIATETPFTFSTSGAATNATTITAAGLFDNTCSTQSGTTGICTANTGVMNMFSAQEISVSVSDGDSLSVTWTITVGNSS